ncbi:MAG: nucleotidyltransferase domain-containing protein [Candidatus Thermoplasmatota archaeon]
MPKRHVEIIISLLRQHVPRSEVWAYGSRVTGAGHEASDLDLVVRNPQDLAAETYGLVELKEAFSESDLPIRVDVLDWARIPASFRREIGREHLVVQREWSDDHELSK